MLLRILHTRCCCVYCIRDAPAYTVKLMLLRILYTSCCVYCVIDSAVYTVYEMRCVYSIRDAAAHTVYEKQPRIMYIAYDM